MPRRRPSATAGGSFSKRSTRSRAINTRTAASTASARRSLTRSGAQRACRATRGRSSGATKPTEEPRAAGRTGRRKGGGMDGRIAPTSRRIPAPRLVIGCAVAAAAEGATGRSSGSVAVSARRNLLSTMPQAGHSTAASLRLNPHLAQVDNASLSTGIWIQLGLQYGTHGRPLVTIDARHAPIARCAG